MMDEKIFSDLLRCETDIDGALNRFADNKPLYIACLDDFLDDPTMDALGEALACQAWDEAFTAAHALKGLAGNMGFIPIFHAAAELVVLIRAGRTKELGGSYARLKECYDQVTSVIRSCDKQKGINI